MRRVVVTGIGMCTPLGYGVDINWKKLINSQSGIRKLEGFEIADLASKIGRQVPLEGNSNFFPPKIYLLKIYPMRYSIKRYIFSRSILLRYIFRRYIL